MKIQELEIDDYNSIMDKWMLEKYKIDGWGEYYYLKDLEGWNDKKIYEEFEKLFIEFEEDLKDIEFQYEQK